MKTQKQDWSVLYNWFSVWSIGWFWRTFGHF